MNGRRPGVTACVIVALAALVLLIVSVGQIVTGSGR